MSSQPQRIAPVGPLVADSAAHSSGPVRVYPIGPPSALNPERTLAVLGVQPGDVVAVVIELLTRAGGQRPVLTGAKLTEVTRQAAILLDLFASDDADTATDLGVRP